ncbi:hypothetical protein M378DRAFT_163131, partial [Amanita muscaria Koide BX008]
MHLVVIPDLQANNYNSPSQTGARHLSSDMFASVAIANACFISSNLDLEFLVLRGATRVSDV